MKQFNDWNEIKKNINNHKNKKVGFKTRDIFYINMGENIGFEQNGKGADFVRPIVILKVFNREMFFAIPLSSQIKEGKFYYSFEFEAKDKSINKNVALLSQMRLFSSKRLLNKIGMINKNDFKNMKDNFKNIID